MSSLVRHIDESNTDKVVLIELPTDTYFEAMSHLVKLFVKNGFEGVYISFQRPFNNVVDMLKRQGVDTGKLLFIDVASIVSGDKLNTDPRCVHIPEDLDIDSLVRAVYTSLPKLGSKKRFIFMDSLATMFLYHPLSEIMRFSEFLSRIAKESEAQDVMLFNVPEDFVREQFIKDIAFSADMVTKAG